MSQTSEALRRMSSRLDMCDCEVVLKAADRIDELEVAIQRSVIKLERDGMQPGWGVVKDWLRAALHRGVKP
jgi:hypothetical protein